MQTIKQMAENYQPPQTKNISELAMVPIDVEIKEEEGQKSDGEKFRYNYIEIKEEKFRVPNKVLADLKTLLENNPNMKYFRVVRKGQGVKTNYTTFPIEGTTEEKVQ